MGISKLVMVLNIDHNKINFVYFKGKGGKEQEILSCFTNNLVRKSGRLIDCQDVDTGERYEFKRQKNRQWFNPRKFTNLSDDDKNITIVFVLTDHTDHCDEITTVKLGDFVKRCYSSEQLRDANRYAKKYPKDQIKSGIDVREFIKNNSDVVKTIWKLVRV